MKKLIIVGTLVLGLIGCSQSTEATPEVTSVYEKVGHVEAEFKRDLYMNPKTKCIYIHSDRVFTPVAEQKYERGYCQGYYQDKLDIQY